MNSEQKQIARIMFQNKVLRASGTAFEDIFTQVMDSSESGFRQIKPQGRTGDRKNDGYIKSKGTFFQVYSPEEPGSKSSPSKAIKKASEDFAGLAEYWGQFCEVREYFFVYNDKYRGSYPEVEKALAGIKSNHDLDDSGVILAKDIENWVFKLTDDQIKAIVGFLPSPDAIAGVDYSCFTEVVEHVMNQFKPIKEGDLIAPDFDEKLEYNKLGREVQAFLNRAFFQVQEVEGYFELNSEFTRQSVRDRVKNMYMMAIEEYRGYDIASKSDHIFWSLVKAMEPGGSSTAEAAAKSIQDAIFVLVAYYFHSCDIFENPSTQEPT